jgi:hypothetical protein
VSAVGWQGAQDWLWGTYKIFAYAFEMYPTSSAQGGFYPSGSVIARVASRSASRRQTSPRPRACDRHAATVTRNKGRWGADCPYKVIGKEDTYC